MLQSGLSGGKGWRHIHRKDTRVIDVLRTREVTEKGHVEIRVSPSKRYWKQ